MDESLFERIACADVTLWLTLLASALLCAGGALCLVAGVWRRRLDRWVALGLMGAAAAALMVFGWAVVVARTGFHERLYGTARSGSGPWLWPLYPPAEHYDATERTRHKPTDPLFRSDTKAGPQGAPPARGWGAVVPADRLDSVGNLALLGGVFAAGGLAFGLACGLAWRRVASRGPADDAADGREPAAEMVAGDDRD